MLGILTILWNRTWLSVCFQPSLFTCGGLCYDLSMRFCLSSVNRCLDLFQVGHIVR